MSSQALTVSDEGGGQTLLLEVGSSKTTSVARVLEQKEFTPYFSAPGLAADKSHVQELPEPG